MLGGDEIAVKRASVRTDFGDLGSLLRVYLPRLAPTANPLMQLRVAATALVRGGELVRGYSRANCEVAAHTAERIGLGRGVVAGLTDIYERWDGTGGARQRRGEDIALAARIAQVAVVASLFYGLGGLDAAVEALRRRAGLALDPHLVEVLQGPGKRSLDMLAGADPVTAAVSVEPTPAVEISSTDLDRVCRAFGEVVDLKTPLHHGHASGVADLAAAAGQVCGLDHAEISRLRRAALVHDIGRAAIPNGIWERRGALSWTDQERVRLHAYHGERVLARCGPLASLAPLAGMHHERLDGSGYHRQVAAQAIPFAARRLAAADA
jgi:response regulator RpfG family c-di-GMP phosphodiesterase